MGRAAAVLSTPRIAGFAALAAIVGVYYATHQWWFELSHWPSLAWICFLLIPAVVGLVWLALPLWRAPLRQLVVLAVACGAAAVLLQWAGAGILANFGKLAAMTLVGWCFLRFFEELSWVVLVALSFEFPVPGSDAGARLGLPDLLFFALYLGAAARWNLRVGWTWVCLTASLGGTLALATWPALDVSGLPALPLLSVGFLLPNADLLWRAVRDRRAKDPRRSPT